MSDYEADCEDCFTPEPSAHGSSPESQPSPGSPGAGSPNNKSPHLPNTSSFPNTSPCPSAQSQNSQNASMLTPASSSDQESPPANSHTRTSSPLLPHTKPREHISHLPPTQSLEPVQSLSEPHQLPPIIRDPQYRNNQYTPRGRGRAFFQSRGRPRRGYPYIAKPTFQSEPALTPEQESIRQQVSEGLRLFGEEKTRQADEKWKRVKNLGYGGYMIVRSAEECRIVNEKVDRDGDVDSDYEEVDRGSLEEVEKIVVRSRRRRLEAEVRELRRNLWFVQAKHDALEFECRRRQAACEELQERIDKMIYDAGGLENGGLWKGTCVREAGGSEDGGLWKGGCVSKAGDGIDEYAERVSELKAVPVHRMAN